MAFRNIGARVLTFIRGLVRRDRRDTQQRLRSGTIARRTPGQQNRTMNNAPQEPDESEYNPQTAIEETYALKEKIEKQIEELQLKIEMCSDVAKKRKLEEELNKKEKICDNQEALLTLHTKQLGKQIAKTNRRVRVAYQPMADKVSIP